jgi:energy-converting hydrogenase Eha subunit H
MDYGTYNDLLRDYIFYSIMLCAGVPGGAGVDSYEATRRSWFREGWKA